MGTFVNTSGDSWRLGTVRQSFVNILPTGDNTKGAATADREGKCGKCSRTKVIAICIPLCGILVFAVVFGYLFASNNNNISRPRQQNATGSRGKFQINVFYKTWAYS